MAWISAVFFCLGAADTLLGDRLGLGSAFRQGFAAVVDLLLLMTGFMALAPWLGTHLAPVITPVFSAVGCDPSLFASLFLSCDAGGAVLAARLQLEPASITGLVVTSANCIPTLLSLDTLEERGITLNTAYAVVAAYSVGDFLAFTLQFSPAHALPMMAGRLLSGLLAVVLCLKTTPKNT